jgi:hypothetical protein
MIRQRGGELFEHFGREPGFWFGGWLLFILLLLGLVAFGVWLFRRRGTFDDDPMRRAAGRYASGKIERVEFERIQRDLSVAARSASPVPPAAPPSEGTERGAETG